MNNKVKAELLNSCLKTFSLQKEKAILLVRSDTVRTRTEILREHLIALNESKSPVPGRLDLKAVKRTGGHS